MKIEPVKIVVNDFAAAARALADSEDERLFVCYAILSEHFTTLAELRSHLSDAERERAAKFRLESDQKRFVARRGLLRVLLAEILNEAPGSIDIATISRGKPFLTQWPDIHFNVSHSDGIAFYVFAKSVRVGIDIEGIREVSDVQSMSRVVLCPADTEWLASLPNEVRTRAFFRLWTRAEAYVKGTGVGLQKQMTRSFQDCDRSGFCRMSDSESSATQWNIFDFTPAENLAGALAVESKH